MIPRCGTNDIPTYNYKNCGRKQMLDNEQQKEVVKFVVAWRHKRFCTCRYIVLQLKLDCTPKTIANVLRRNGYRWKALPRVRGLSKAELDKRQMFVDAHINHPPSWWQEQMSLVFDGVTLTKAPASLNQRQRHVAQSITHNWIKDGEQVCQRRYIHGQLRLRRQTWLFACRGAGSHPPSRIHSCFTF